MWFVYMLRCSDGSLYTGITTDPPRRFRQHNLGKGGAYTRAKLPVRLVFEEIQRDRPAALRREAQIKRLSRPEKERLSKTRPAFRGQKTVRRPKRAAGKPGRPGGRGKRS